MRKEKTINIAVSQKNHQRLKKIAELRKQSIYIVLGEFIEKMAVELFDEENKIA